MWTSAKTIRAYVETLKRCQRCCAGTVWRGDADRGQRPLYRVLSSASKPKWRLLFFGTDHFAVESLKLLTSCRCESHTRRSQACTQGFTLQRVTYHTHRGAIVCNNIVMFFFIEINLNEFVEIVSSSV